MANKGKVTALDATENQKGVSTKGTSGGGISTINKLPPDSSGNFTVQGNDFSGIVARESEYPGKTLEILARESTFDQRGVIRRSRDTTTIEGEESNFCVTPVSLKAKLGDQTKNYFCIGRGQRDPLQWATIVSTTLDYSYDDGKINLNVKNPTQSDWSTVRMTEGDYKEYAKDKTIYIADRANGACTIGLKDNAEYKDHTEIEVYSLRHGFQITAENPEKGEVQIRYMDKFSTKGTGSLRSPNYGDPNDNLSWVKLTFYKELGLWIAQYYSSTNFEVS